MSSDVQAFFEGLPARIPAERTAGLTASYCFEIDGEGAWTVTIDDGALAVADGAQSADCTIAASADNFLRIVRGEQNATTAYMTGKLKIKGDMGAAMKLQQLF